MNDTISQLALPVGPAVVNRASESPARPVKVAATNQVRHDSPSESRQKSETATLENLAESVDRLNADLKDAQHGLRFSVDDDSGRIVVKVIDLDTDDVIRQIPSEEALALINKMGGNDGLIFNEEA